MCYCNNNYTNNKLPLMVDVILVWSCPPNKCHYLLSWRWYARHCLDVFFQVGWDSESSWAAAGVLLTAPVMARQAELCRLASLPTTDSLYLHTIAHRRNAGLTMETNSQCISFRFCAQFLPAIRLKVINVHLPWLMSLFKKHHCNLN